ncbi:MAG: hypothetical protein ACUVWB_03390 [Anaerolineae bacterium]
MSWKERMAERLFGGLIEARVQEAVKVVDDAWWRLVNAPAAPAEPSWLQRQEDLEAALKAWRDHPLARRIVSLTTDYVLGDGLSISSTIPEVDEWARRFWTHPQNRLDSRLYSWVDELTRAGELFIVLSRNPADGMSYVRLVPACRIDQIDTDPDDLERERRYHEVTSSQLLEGGRWWPAAETADPHAPQVIFHAVINRPPGAVRGEGDLTPILPWLGHYAAWLEDRVRVNRLKSSFVWQVTLRGATPAVIAQKRAEYSRPPSPGSVIISNEGERWEAVQPHIDAQDAQADGKAMRLLVAAGAGVPLHFLSEGESATRATAAEMGDLTFRHYRRRQMEVCRIVEQLVEVAYQRAVAIGKARFYERLELTVSAPEIVRDDNETLSRATRQMVEALARMRELGWVDTRRAIRLAFKAAGELISEEDIDVLVQTASTVVASGT